MSDRVLFVLIILHGTDDLSISSSEWTPKWQYESSSSYTPDTSFIYTKPTRSPAAYRMSARVSYCTACLASHHNHHLIHSFIVNLIRLPKNALVLPDGTNQNRRPQLRIPDWTGSTVSGLNRHIFKSSKMAGRPFIHQWRRMKVVRNSHLLRPRQGTTETRALLAPALHTRAYDYSQVYTKQSRSRAPDNDLRQPS